jgi:hypothetical protein
MTDCYQVTVIEARGKVKMVYRALRYPEIGTRVLSFQNLQTEKHVRILLGADDTVVIEEMSTETPPPVE